MDGTFAFVLPLAAFIGDDDDDDDDDDDVCDRLISKY